MGPWETESEHAEREHNDGQEDGSKSDFLSQIVHSGLHDLYSDEYNAGWDNGVANPSSNDD